MREKKEARVLLDWSCGKCGHLGTMLVYQRKDETVEEAARRCSSNTRRNCVQGCTYIAEIEEAHR